MKKHLLIAVMLIAINSFLSCKKDNPGNMSIINPPIVDTLKPNTSYPEGSVPDAQLIGNLSHAGNDVVATACLDKLFFASTDSGNIATAQTSVDIFDLRTFDMITVPLSRNRRKITAVAAESMVFFAGGYDGAPVSRVDIYDVKNDSWSSSELSIPRYDLAAVAFGNKVYFAGGLNASGAPVTRVDIYDITSNSWTTAELSEGRSNFAAAALGDSIMFCGGKTQYYNQSTIVDVFNTSTNNWTTTSMPFALSDCKAQVLGNNIFVGGTGPGGSLGPLVNIYRNPFHQLANRFQFS